MEEVIPEEEEEPVTIEDITPREGVKGVFGDTPIARLLIFMNGQRKAVTWGEIHRNVEPPEHYEWGHIVDALLRLIQFEAIDEVKPGMFWMNHGAIAGILRRLCEESSIKTREAKGLRPIIPRVNEGMLLRTEGGNREFFFNGEELTGNVEREWWPFREKKP